MYNWRALPGSQLLSLSRARGMMSICNFRNMLPECKMLENKIRSGIVDFFFSGCIINSDFSRSSYSLFPRHMEVVYCSQHYIWSWYLIYLETFSERQQKPMSEFKKSKLLELWSEQVSLHKVWFSPFVK